MIRQIGIHIHVERSSLLYETTETEKESYLVMPIEIYFVDVTCTFFIRDLSGWLLWYSNNEEMSGVCEKYEHKSNPKLNILDC